MCRQGYHGIEPCKIKDTQIKEICESYLNGDQFVRDELIKRYGEIRIKRAIEESSSMDYLNNTSKQCPNCRTWINKIDGCNKMACIKCHCYFCWLCSKVLSKTDPYAHFNTSNSECNGKLFEGALNNNDNDDHENGNDDDEDEEEEHFHENNNHLDFFHLEDFDDDFDDDFVERRRIDDI
jgi:E3 ubiquitin-protein ligase RNF14